MSPGMRENLFNPMPKEKPCLGSVSPVSSVKSPGLPSSAGIGVKFGSSESASAEAVAFAWAAPELGLGGATGTAVGAVAAAEELAGVVAVPEVPMLLAVAESVAAVAVFAVASLAEGAPAAVAPALAVPSAT